MFEIPVSASLQSNDDYFCIILQWHLKILFLVEQKNLVLELIMELENRGKCLNCGFEPTGDFCASCGQSSTVSRITIKETWDHFLSSAFSFEGPLLYTIKQLILSPGAVFREFVGGRRKQYYKPVAFFILTSALYIIVRAIIGFNPLEGAIDPKIDQSTNEVMRNIGVASRFMVDNINNIMFFLVFSLALVFKMFYSKRYNLAEYASMGFYITGIYIQVGILFMLFSQFVFRINNGYQLIFLIFYVIYCTRSLIAESSFLSYLKYVLIALFGILLYMIFGFGFSYLWVSVF
ncbi:MAG: hypothetical protein CL840_16860 [Crocinitomicaceae bacterium]|nr:hypothetical protein [Crocinitomicaceae bacterium]|tara:strand:+ start:709 stop:1581 length:873 start_codon:yes stop_codon:yes gene_type:complete